MLLRKIPVLQAVVFWLLVLCAACFAPARFACAEEEGGPLAETNFEWPIGPLVHADAAIVMEATTGMILYEKNSYAAYAPGYITKVLTALLALENCSVNEVVTMSDAAEHNVTGNRIGLVSGEQILLEDALYGMLLESANEVSYAVAEHVAARKNKSKGSMEEFAALMNQRAEELGCVNSHFVNSSGLHDEEHYTCAYDMALIGKEAISFAEFRKIAGTRTYTIPPTNKNVSRPIANRHRFIRKTMAYDYAIAGITGGAGEALTTLVTYAEKNGMNLVAVVLHVDTALHAYEDTISMLNFAFDNYSLYEIEEAALGLDADFPSLFSQVPAFGAGPNLLVRIRENSNVILPHSANFSQAEKTITYAPVEEFVHGENVIGQIVYTFAGKQIGFADIIYDNPNYPMTKAAFEALWPSYLIPPDFVFKEEDGVYLPIYPNEGDAADQEDAKTIPLAPLLFGGAVMLVVLLVGIYLAFIYLPRRKKRTEYKRRRNWKGTPRKR